MELLLSLGVVPSPLDAYTVLCHPDTYIYDKYIRHLKTHGFNNLEELQQIFFELDYNHDNRDFCHWSPTIDGPFPESDEEEDDYYESGSEEESQETEDNF